MEQRFQVIRKRIHAVAAAGLLQNALRKVPEHFFARCKAGSASLAIPLAVLFKNLPLLRVVLRAPVIAHKRVVEVAAGGLGGQARNPSDLFPFLIQCCFFCDPLRIFQKAIRNIFQKFSVRGVDICKQIA